eukprot:Skav220484  [mRNA]  locus=scaffold591:122622:126770:+ [translate_table: standard]
MLLPHCGEGPIIDHQHICNHKESKESLEDSQELHAERDVLLKRADKRVDAHSTQKDDGKNNARALLWTCGLLFFPGVAYTFIILAWFFVFHSSIAKFLAIFACLLGSSVVVIILSFRWPSSRIGATMAGLVIGFFLYYRNLIYYWNYNAPWYLHILG